MAITKVHRLSNGLWVEREQTGLPDEIPLRGMLLQKRRGDWPVHLVSFVDVVARMREFALTEYGKGVLRLLTLLLVRREAEERGLAVLVWESYGGGGRTAHPGSRSPSGTPLWGQGPFVGDSGQLTLGAEDADTP